MSRISIGDGRWFDPDKAERFDEDRRFDGRNYISVATGTQFEHERLYRTARGTWVLYWWSQWQGTTPRFRTIGEEAAHKWLIRNGHDDAVPAAVLSANEL